MSHRIVIKVGTKVLANEAGLLDVAAMRRIVDQIVALRKKGTEVILVTSGAVAAGKGIMKGRKVEGQLDRQLLAAIGQLGLMQAYVEQFARHGLVCAQVLLTKEDFRDRAHYSNMKGCIERLVHDAVIPVLNENDVVSIEELLFTDNDELAGLVASMTGASKVIILSSVAGVLANGKAVPTISLQDISEAEKHVGVGVSVGGRGGMASKFRVAKKLMLQGIGVHIADGRKPNVVLSIMEDKLVGTTFVPSKIVPSVKRRIAHSDGLALGTVRVNKCFEETLASPEAASLLPVGIVEVQGDFEKGDVVEIVGESGRHLGFGIAAYGPEAARRVIGLKRQRPFVHYDYMFIEI